MRQLLKARKLKTRHWKASFPSLLNLQIFPLIVMCTVIWLREQLVQPRSLSKDKVSGSASKDSNSNSSRTSRSRNRNRSSNKYTQYLSHRANHRQILMSLFNLAVHHPSRLHINNIFNIAQLHRPSHSSSRLNRQDSTLSIKVHSRQTFSNTTQFPLLPLSQQGLMRQLQTTATCLVFRTILSPSLPRFCMSGRDLRLRRSRLQRADVLVSRVSVAHGQQRKKTP